MRRSYSVLHICIILLTVWIRKKTRSQESQESNVTFSPEDIGESNAERSGTGIIPNYEFIPDFGWYRLHTIPAIWEDARLRCNMEGGVLASPTSNAVIKVIKDTMHNYGMDQNVFVDIIASKPKGNFSSLNGRPLEDLGLPWAKGEPNNLNNDENCLAMSSDGHLSDVSCTQVLQYICVKVEELPLKCDTTDIGYKMNQELESCYKFVSDPVPWRVALMMCNADHAYLAVINSFSESQALKDLYKEHPESTIEGATLPDRVSIGVWSWEEEREFKTIHGELLDQAGFGKWAKDHPSKQALGRNCGSMTRDGLLSDIDCIRAKQPFICEVQTSQPRT